MKKFHEVERIEFEGEFMTLVADGRAYRMSISAASDRLANATDIQRCSYRVSPSGYGIHWPEIDEDLSVDGLIALTKYPNPSSASIFREGENPV
jgi:hypothetical protein